MTTTERRQIEQLHLVNNHASVKTASGKDAFVFQNLANINRPYFQLYIEGKIVFTRGPIARVFQELNNN